MWEDPLRELVQAFDAVGKNEHACFGVLEEASKASEPPVGKKIPLETYEAE